MPIYEYECGSCGRRFEQLQRMADEPLTTDPDCGGTVRRVIQPVGIIFKGSGFYVTDSRKSSSASSSSSSESTGTTSPSDAKKESSSSAPSTESSSSSTTTSTSSSESKGTPAVAA